MRDLSIIQKQSTMQELPTMQELSIMCEVLMPEQTIMQEAIMRVMASFMQEEATTDSFFQEGKITVTWLQISCAYKNVFNHMKYFMPF